ncbi:MAG TPA: response regulator, partial [Prolixibacteraceae bacterium]|nr:response regulator [Prolixibacteraceae bacterium]
MIKILLIDDDKFSLLNLQTTLSNLIPNTKILNADNGETGIQLAQENNPDVILLDICMPGMDGIEVCHHLKSDIRTQNIPVLFATSLRDDIEVGNKAIEAGGEGFLSKPFNKVELTAQIRAMVKIKKTHLTEKEEKKKLQKLINQHTKQLKAELENRKKTEKTLREQEQALKQSQEIANLGSWEINFKSNTLNWSENYYRLFGFEPFEVIPTFSLFIDMVFPDDRKIIKTAIERLKRKKKVPQFQYRIVTKDGTLKWLQNYVVPVYSRNELIMLKGVDFDITKRQTAEEELQKKIKITREHECLSRIN